MKRTITALALLAVGYLAGVAVPAVQADATSAITQELRGIRQELQSIRRALEKQR